MQPGPRAASWVLLFVPTTAVSTRLSEGPISQIARVGSVKRSSVP